MIYPIFFPVNFGPGPLTFWEFAKFCFLLPFVLLLAVIIIGFSCLIIYLAWQLLLWIFAGCPSPKTIRAREKAEQERQEKVWRDWAKQRADLLKELSDLKK